MTMHASMQCIKDKLATLSEYPVLESDCIRLRGIRESGVAFAIPTYAYTVLLGGLIASFAGDELKKNLEDEFKVLKSSV